MSLELKKYKEYSCMAIIQLNISSDCMGPSTYPYPSASLFQPFPGNANLLFITQKSMSCLSDNFLMKKLDVIPESCYKRY